MYIIQVFELTRFSGGLVQTNRSFVILGNPVKYSTVEESFIEGNCTFQKLLRAIPKQKQEQKRGSAS